MKIFLKLIFFALTTVLFVGCVSSHRVVESWPESLPSLDYYQNAYWSDSENQSQQTIEAYLTWVQRFYEGWAVYENGWNKMSVELVEKILDEQKRRLMSQKIAVLGREISVEWAKQNDNRFIDTKAVSVWGESLLEALDRDQTLWLIEEVRGDIRLLETEELALDQVVIERYFPDLEDESDDFLFF